MVAKKDSSLEGAERNCREWKWPFSPGSSKGEKAGLLCWTGGVSVSSRGQRGLGSLGEVRGTVVGGRESLEWAQRPSRVGGWCRGQERCGQRALEVLVLNLVVVPGKLDDKGSFSTACCRIGLARSC